MRFQWCHTLLIRCPLEPQNKHCISVVKSNKCQKNLISWGYLLLFLGKKETNHVVWNVFLLTLDHFNTHVRDMKWSIEQGPHSRLLPTQHKLTGLHRSFSLASSLDSGWVSWIKSINYGSFVLSCLSILPSVSVPSLLMVPFKFMTPGPSPLVFC